MRRREMRAGNLKVKTDNPSGYLRQILDDYKSPRFDYLPSFTGGLSDIFHMIISATASLRCGVTWRTPKLLRTSTLCSLTGSLP